MEYRSADTIRDLIVRSKADRCSEDDVSLDSNAEDDTPLLTLAAVLTIDTMATALSATTQDDRLCKFDQAIAQALQSMDATVEERNKNR
ncbi:unnamed protein product [Mucor hiemalis]